MPNKKQATKARRAPDAVPAARASWLIRLPYLLADDIDARAQKRGLTRLQLVIELLDKALDATHAGSVLLNHRAEIELARHVATLESQTDLPMRADRDEAASRALLRGLSLAAPPEPVAAPALPALAVVLSTKVDRKLQAHMRRLAAKSPGKTLNRDVVATETLERGLDEIERLLHLTERRRAARATKQSAAAADAAE